MKKRILIIDDDKFNCLVYKMVLKELDIEIEFAADGRQGVDKYLNNSYDLVLLDMGLPIIAGCDAAKIMRLFEQEHPDRRKTPIIAVSANDTAEMQRNAFDAGVDQYTFKPINNQQLITAIESHLDNKSEEPGNYSDQQKIAS